MLCSQICKTAICSLFYSYCKVDFCFSIQNLRICKSKVFIYSRIVSLSATSFCIFTALKIIGILWKRKKIAVFEALPLECIRPCIQKYTCKFILFISFKDVFFYLMLDNKLCIGPSIQCRLNLQWTWKQCRTFLCDACWLLHVSVLFRGWCFYQLLVSYNQQWCAQNHHLARRCHWFLNNSI